MAAAGKVTSRSRYQARDFHTDVTFEEQLEFRMGDMCKLWGETPAAMNNYMATGILKKSEAFKLGHYDVLNSTKQFIGHLKSLIRESKANAKSREDPQKKRWLKARASLMELQLARADNKLVEVKSIEHFMADAGVRVRQKLTSIPSRAAPLLAVETDVAVIQNILADMVREACDEFTGTWDGMAGDDGATEVGASDEGILEGHEDAGEDDDQ